MLKDLGAFVIFYLIKYVLESVITAGNKNLVMKHNLALLNQIWNLLWTGFMVKILKNNLGVRFGVKFLDQAWAFMFLVLRIGLSLTCLYTLVVQSWKIMSCQYRLWTSRKMFTKSVSWFNTLLITIIFIVEFLVAFITFFMGFLCYSCLKCCCGMKLGDFMVMCCKCFTGWNLSVAVIMFSAWYEERDVRLIAGLFGFRLPGDEYKRTSKDDAKSFIDQRTTTLTF